MFVAACVVASAGCEASGRDVADRRPPTTPSLRRGRRARAPDTMRFTTVVAQARVANVEVFASPGARKPHLSVRRSQLGGPLIFLVRHSERGWLRVLLPVRPNGSSGWIRRADVGLSEHDYRIVVELAAHRITVYKGATIVDREPVGVGKTQTPTPRGVYYTKELLQPADPRGIYGPFAYQLSGFSDVLTHFNGGTEIIGIHGTNEPWLI